MANSVNVIDKIDCTTARVNKIKYITNTKGNTLITDASSNLKEFAVGANDQVVVADSTTAEGLKWYTIPSAGTVSVINFTGSILSFANNNSFTFFNPHSISDVSNRPYIESQYLPFNSTLVCLSVIPAGNSLWPAGTDFAFRVGYLRGTVNTDPPDQFSSITATTCSFVNVGTSTITVNNTYSGTRNPAIGYFTSPVLGDEYITVRCTNNTATAGTIFTVTVWLRTTL